MELVELNKQLAENGELFLADISMETYLAHDSVSRSQISLLDKMTPKHFKFSRDNPSVRKQTPDMLIGSAVHKYFFERDEFRQCYLTAPELNLRKKADREEMEIFKADAARIGQEVLTKEQMAKVEAVGDALHANKAVSSLVSGGVTERSIFRPYNKFTLKTRPDYYKEECNTIIDLKTCKDVSPKGFLRSVIDYQYYVQDAYYVDAVAHFREAKPRFLIVAVEKEPPYESAIYELENSFQMVGRATYIRALALIQECMDKDQWPGYPDTAIDLRCPDWLWEGFKKQVRSEY